MPLANLLVIETSRTRKAKIMGITTIGDAARRIVDRLNLDRVNAGKAAEPESPASANEGGTHPAGEINPPRVMRLVIGGMDLGTVNRRYGLPRPAVPNSMLRLVGGRDHASSPMRASSR